MTPHSRIQDAPRRILARAETDSLRRLHSAESEDVPAFDLPANTRSPIRCFPITSRQRLNLPRLVKTRSDVSASHGSKSIRHIAVKFTSLLQQELCPFFPISLHPITDPSGYDAGVMTDIYPLFAHGSGSMRDTGNVALKHLLQTILALRRELPVHTNLPSQGRATLMKQEDEKRYVLHLL